MENMDKKTCGCSVCQAGGSCGGGQGMCGHHGCCGKHHLVKIILKIFIVILFWCGFQLGQESGFIKATYGREMRGSEHQYGMMQSGGWNNYSNTQVVPTTPGIPTTQAPMIPAK